MSAPAAGEAVPGLHRAEGLEESLDLEGRVIGILEEGVIVCDRDGVPVLANERAVELTGMPFAALVAGAQRAPGEGVGGGQVWPAVLEALRAGEGERPAVEGTGMRSDGSEFPFEARILSLQAGEHHFSVAVIEDISKHRAAERRLADARDDALRASVVKSEFLATMSHEIRTPMNAVIGTLDLMLDCELTPELAELADIARNAANDLLVIIDDILDLSKIEADRLESRHDSFALVATVEAAADILAANALRKSVALATYIDPAIPARVRGDPRMLRQTLVNLIGNAVKFTERGEVTVHAEHVSSPAGAASVRFSVRDTGPGIPAEAVETLFEPFTQAGTHASSEQGGSGLGLAISSRLVRLMGGRLTVESELGRGSVFSFELPLERAQDEAGDETATLGPMRVLIVADAGAAAQTVALYLRDWGVTVANAPDAHTALERFSAAAADGEPFDVAIIAVGAAQADDARAAAAQLRRDAGPGGVFLIALGEVGERLSPAAGASGFDAVVTMPVKQGRLLEALAGVRPRQDGDASPAREEDPAGDGVRGLRVLIAEDNLVNQQVLMRQVHRLGLVADAVANGREVLEALERDDYDAVLMDCQMPVMDGYTAAREIRSREAGGTRHIPIVAVTANAMQDDLERCREAGMDGFVAKPVTLAALAGAIERSVAERRSAATAAQEPADAPAVAPGEAAADATPSPPAPASGAASAVDRPILDSLREDLGGASALVRIVRLFLEQLDPQAEQIEQDHRSGDLATLARNAHRMKSSAATLGALEMAELLVAIEETARAQDAAACDPLVARFAAAVGATREAFQVILEELEVEVDGES